MSRFWGAGSDSESEEEEKGFFSKRAASDDDDEDDERDDDDEEGKEEKSGDEGSGEEADFWNRPDSDDEDENEEKRVVVSRQVKRNEALLNSIKAIKNAIKINDWGVIQEEFDNLVKIVQKPTSGLDKVVIPRGFIRCVVHIEDAFEFSWENKDKKKMSAANLKGLNSMKQKIRKVRQQYENEIGSFRSNPIDTDQSEEEKKGQQEPAEAEVEEEPAEEELAPEDVDKKVAEILSTRGKKNINRKKQVELLHNLFKIAEEPSSHARVLLALIAIRFDQVTGLTTHLDVPTWKIAQTEFVKLLELLEKNEDLVVTTEIEEGAEEIPESQQRPAVRGKKLIPGSLVAIVERLDDEFLKSLQNIDAHTTEYIDRLRDEPDLYEAIVRTQHYYTRTGGVEKDNDSISRTLIRRVEHIYFKPDNINNALEKKVADRLKKGGAAGEINSNALIQELCSTLYKSGNEVIRTRALLCHVFHHALHGRYFKARDLLLMSHLQETIQNADISTKILFNRAMVQTGLCAFRHGMLKESQNALQDIHSTGRAKELLAQGIVSQKGVEKTAEQERLEKHRQIPFHMHVNLELLECAFFTCSMILEVPFMASGNHEARKRVVSKPFRRLLDFSEKQVFTGPPENTRDHIMQAAKALMSGEWEKSTKLIEAIKIWDLMPQAAEIKAMLATKIQLSGLQTFLLTYSNFYETLSLEKLSQMFKLSKAEVHGAVSKMIVNEELYASLDQVTGVVVIHRVEPTKLQFLSLQFTEKAQSLIELNEKILEVRTGNLGGRDEKQQGQQGQQQGRGGYKQYNSNQRNFKQNNPTGGQRQFNPNYRFQKGPRPRYQNTGSREYSGNQRDRDSSNQYQRGDRDRENQYQRGDRENQYQREGQYAGN